jgi:transcriptional regulator with XRE-family HTH domain
MFYDNYVNLCNSIKKSPSAAAVEMGFEKSSVTRWKKGSTPTDASLQKIAEYFGVTTDYLKGDSSTVETAGAPYDFQAAFWGGDKDLSPEEKELLWKDVQEYAKFKMDQMKKNKK